MDGTPAHNAAARLVFQNFLVAYEANRDWRDIAAGNGRPQTPVWPTSARNRQDGEPNLRSLVHVSILRVTLSNRSERHGW